MIKSDREEKEEIHPWPNLHSGQKASDLIDPLNVCPASIFWAVRVPVSHPSVYPPQMSHAGLFQSDGLSPVGIKGRKPSGKFP